MRKIFILFFLGAWATGFSQKKANEIILTVLGTSKLETTEFLKGLYHKEPTLSVADSSKSILVTTLQSKSYLIDFYLLDSCYQGVIIFKDASEFDKLFKSVSNTCPLTVTDEASYYNCEGRRKLAYRFDVPKRSAMIFDRALLAAYFEK